MEMIFCYVFLLIFGICHYDGSGKSGGLIVYAKDANIFGEELNGL
jgi:hypothetical protein